MARRPKLTEDAQAIYDALAGKGWKTYGDLKFILRTPDHRRIAIAWNELKAAGLTRGEMLRGATGEVLTEPD